MPKYRLTGNLSYSWRAMRISRSQTPTISHPSTLWICDACASAILPHPTMPILSICHSVSARFEITSESLCHRYLWRPTHSRLEFFVAVARPLPIGTPVSPIEDGRQLSLRPVRVLLPQITERVT